MKPESIAFGVAGILFGLIAGWIIGSQQAACARRRPRPRAAPAAAGEPRRAVLDEAKVNALKAGRRARAVERRAPRRSSANLYFDAERYDEAIKWYERGAQARRRTTWTSARTWACRTTTRTSLTGRSRSSTSP